MQNNLAVPAGELHRDVLDELDGLLRKMEVDARDGRVGDALEKARKLVGPIHAELAARIEVLEKHARWDTFTIAFYGETNAGKSTIIETLRILLGESTKLEERCKFRAKQAELGLSESALQALADSIESSGAQIETLRGQLHSADSQLQADLLAQDRALDQLREQIAARQRQASFFARLLMRLRKLPEQETFAEGERERMALVAAQASQGERLAEQIKQIEDGRALLDSQLAAVHAQRDSLSKLADGVIVGTGRSDFTLETHGYVFDVDGQRIELLDVPGIEGKEARVIDSIMSAVRAAHAVFYVTGKAAAPQTGDRKGQGTLEKIHAHLGDQAEVWSIFNKRINNPIQLQKGGLLNQGERDSLKVLDETLNEHLHGHYQGHIALSAQPAFLAVAECLAPLSDLARNRAKFLARFDTESLLRNSGFQEFTDQLTQTIVGNCEARIRRANVNKVHSAIVAATGKIVSVQREVTGPVAARLKNDSTAVQDQLQLAVRSLENTLKATARGEIRGFQARVREHMYGRIGSGIDNGDLKLMLERVLLDEQVVLEARLPELIKMALARFQEEVSQLIEDFRERLEELQDAYRSVATAELGGGFQLDMKFDGGVNYVSLVAAIGSGLLMWWNPVGWVSLVIGGLTLVISIKKAIWGMVDRDYKRSQQRKATDENLDRVIDGMDEAMRKNCAALLLTVEQRIDDIAASVAASARQAAEINSALIDVGKKLTKYSKAMSKSEALA